MSRFCDTSNQTAQMRQSDGVESDLDVGDIVDVPGSMHGVVRFIGNVRGKQGTFAGVELSKEYAARGKNNGDVDGFRYFATSMAGSGIFLPLHRATKRNSSDPSKHAAPVTPLIPSYGSLNLHEGAKPSPAYTPSRNTVPQFSQSIGPGARPQSPQFKPRTSRPSFPRPESPLRKAPVLLPSMHTTPARGSAGVPSFSRSMMGTRQTPSPAPARFGPVKPRTPATTRPIPNNKSRPSDQSIIDKSAESTPVGRPGTSESTAHGLRSRQLQTGQSEIEVRRLTKEVEERDQKLDDFTQRLEERDHQLKDQATSLAEMENSLAELQSLMASNAAAPSKNRSASPSEDVSELRALLREKNDKISMMTADFDAHRADFRSTIDALEMASTETERVYEKRVEELLQEIKELQEQSEDVESVAKQLKQLEDLVQELEEGLEDARRGEAEARGEVEFLRGEVERGRSEHKRELDQKDDEIRGLKAIIYSLSSGKDHLTSPTKREGSPISPPPELWCEICETAGHDILTCNIADPSTQTPKSSSLGAPGSPPKGPLPSPPREVPGAGKSNGEDFDPDKWCALCERDGHDSVSCPFEDTL